MAITRVTGNSFSDLLWASALSGDGTGYVEKAFANPVTAGSLLVAAVQVNGNKTPTFSDGVNTWQTGILSAYSGALDVRIAIGYAMNASAGATTVRATFEDDTKNRSIIIAEYAGVATASAVDGTPTSASGSSDSAMAPGAITSTGDALFIGFALYSSPPGTPTPATNFTGYEASPASAYTLNVEDRIATGAGAINPSWSNKTFWLATGIAFKAAGGASAVDLAGSATAGASATGALGVKKLKLLVNSAAVGATVDGVVFAAGADIVGPEVGEFTGKTIVAGSGADAGKGVLLIPVTDFGGTALNEGAELLVYLKNSTHFTPIWPGLVIAE